MNKPREFYIWLIAMQIIIMVLWRLTELGLYGSIHPSIEDSIIWCCYVPIIFKAYNIGYEQKFWKTMITEDDNG